MTTCLDFLKMNVVLVALGNGPPVMKSVFSSIMARQVVPVANGSGGSISKLVPSTVRKASF